MYIYTNRVCAIYNSFVTQSQRLDLCFFSPKTACSKCWVSPDPKPGSKAEILRPFELWIDGE